MILRTMLASFIVTMWPLLIVAGIILVSRFPSASTGEKAWFYMGILLLSLPLGIVVYIGSGMIAAILRGQGHFYSVPFGGYTASNDTALLICAAVRIGLVFIGLVGILRPRKWAETTIKPPC